LSHIIEYSPDAENHLRAQTARQRTIVLDGVDEQLNNQPTVKTRNRKPMRPDSRSPWGLRIGTLRVYYDVVEESKPMGCVRAIGIKERDQVRIGGR